MKILFFTFLILITSTISFSQGLNKNGQVGGSETNYVSKRGKVGSIGIDKNGKVMLTANSLGQEYQGGVIFYILQNGDIGYDVSTVHGLIVSTVDHPGGIPWYMDGVAINAGTSTVLGSGLSNTNSIITTLSALGAPQSSYAAGVARAYMGGGYSDWHLPSLNEMVKIFQNVGQNAAAPLTNIVNLSTQQYWTSSQKTSTFSYSIDPNNFSDASGNGWSGGLVRAIRSF